MVGGLALPSNDGTETGATCRMSGSVLYALVDGTLLRCFRSPLLVARYVPFFVSESKVLLGGLSYERP